MIKVFQKKVPIHRNKGKTFTLYRENNIRLLEMKEDGYFAVYEVAIVFQNERGFLTTQRVYEGSVFQSGKDLFCPEFDGKCPPVDSFYGKYL